jgi:protein phosphatase 2C family protein 2/3
MFDHEEEDKDLASQVTKGQRTTNEEDRGAREETPGPEAPASTDKQQQQQTTSTSSDKKVIPESAIPEKLVAPPTNQEK